MKCFTSSDGWNASGAGQHSCIILYCSENPCMLPLSSTPLDLGWWCVWKLWAWDQRAQQVGNQQWGDHVTHQAVWGYFCTTNCITHPHKITLIICQKVSRECALPSCNRYTLHPSLSRTLQASDPTYNEYPISCPRNGSRNVSEVVQVVAGCEKVLAKSSPTFSGHTFLMSPTMIVYVVPFFIPISMLHSLSGSLERMSAMVCHRWHLHQARTLLWACFPITDTAILFHWGCCYGKWSSCI